MTVTCAYCGTDTVDAHQIEVCGSCCQCREDLAGEVLAIAEGLTTLAEFDDVLWSKDQLRRAISRKGRALTQLAARLSRTGEAGE